MMRELVERRDSRILPSQLPIEQLSRKIQDSVVTDRAAAIPDCCTCGVCCNFAVMVTATPQESLRLNNYWDITLDVIEEPVTINRMLPRSMESGSCIFLKGTLKENIACEIYENRPHVCRVFDAGSDKCHAYRRMYGIEPPLTDDEVATALAAFEKKLPPGKISFVGIVKYSDYSVHDHNSAMLSSGVKLRIVAFLDEDGETEHDLHIYDPTEETWFENEFLALSLDEARALIASRVAKAS
jgi:Fe-S-cluster containining protein